MSDKSHGLYHKFTVIRNDGRGEYGEKHFGCEYFVLDLDHDRHAIAALFAYADSCAYEYPALAQDLRMKAVTLNETAAAQETEPRGQPPMAPQGTCSAPAAAPDWRTMTVSELAAWNPSLKEYSDRLESGKAELILQGMGFAATLCDKIGGAWHNAGDTQKWYATNYLVEIIRAEIERRRAKSSQRS